MEPNGIIHDNNCPAPDTKHIAPIPRKERGVIFVIIVVRISIYIFHIYISLFNLHYFDPFEFDNLQQHIVDKKTKRGVDKTTI